MCKKILNFKDNNKENNIS